jgi:hypothetical protein
MHIYNHTLSGHDTVSEATLFRQAQAGCRVCLNALMARHDGLVQAVVRRQVLGDLPFAEALQAGRIGLWRAFPSTVSEAASGQAWATTPSMARPSLPAPGLTANSST